MKKIAILFLTLILVLTQGGCWDLQGIEEIGFVMGVGLDPIEDEGQPDNDHHHDQYFRSTYQVAIPSLVRAINEGGGMEQAYFIVSTTGMTNFKMRRVATSRRSRHLKFEHLKIIIIHQDLARQGMLNHLLDFYIRDHEMRRRTNLYISPGDTREILDQDFHLEFIESDAILMLNDNYTRVASMIKPTEIGDVSKDIVGEKSYLLPRIMSQKDDIILNGAAVFMGKTNKMIGWLSAEETESYNWLMGEFHNGVKEIYYEDHLFVFESTDQDAEINYAREGDEDHFYIHIKVEGNFVEDWLHKVSINDLENLEKLEHAISEQITKECYKLIDKLQNEYFTDIFGLYKHVQRENTPYWRTVEDDWDGEEGAFSKAKIHITSEAQIRNYMLQEVLED